VSQTEKLKQLTFPSELLLTTPESLEAILLRKANWNQLFNNLQSIIIDESHYFALTERGSHLLSLLERLEHEIKATPQRIGATATIGNPDELLKWLSGKNRASGKKIFAKSKKEKVKDFKIHFYDHENDSDKTSNKLYDSLYGLLLNKKSIVFRNSRSNTEDSAKYINERNKLLDTKISLKVRTHHSSVSKYYREEAEALIKMKSESSLNAIISTSTLELGIDIGELDQVIQIGEITSSGSFLQRVGRTGRREGKSQYFRGLCESSDDLLLLSACVNLGLHGISENIIFPKKAYHILAHQVICLCLQKMGISQDNLWKILSNAYCFSEITKNKFQKLIQFMIKEDFLRVDGNELLLTSNKTEKLFLNANWRRLFAVFDSGPMYNVVDGKKLIGTLDSNFVRMQELPFIFILGGIEWETLKVNHDTQQVSVRKNTTGNIPKWTLFKSFDIPFEVAQEVGRVLMTDNELAFLDIDAKSGIKREREEYKNLKWNEKLWVVECSDSKKIFIWTFAGDKINRTISTLLNSSKIGKSVYDHMYVEIDPSGNENEDISGEVLNFLIGFRDKTKEDIEIIIKEKLKNIRFSKFSNCLPEELSKETLIDKSLNIERFLGELNNITFQILE
jgi:ATP-dependent Lhr-like helicase